MALNVDDGGRVALFITRKWPPAMGGMETYSVELTSALAQHVALEVVALPGRGDGAPPRLPSVIWFALRTVRRYLQLQRAPLVLHVGDLASWPLALINWFRPEQPVIVLSAHGTDAGYHRRGGVRGWLYGAYLRVGARLLRRARLIANSKATAKAAAETGWNACAIVPLATCMRADTPPGSCGRHLLFAGRLVERKGCRWFVENVLPHLPEDIDLRVAGTVWNEAEKVALENSRVTFLGLMPHAALIEEYRSALCVVVPNIQIENGEFEGFGLVGAEAAAVGGVVLASACGGLVEAVMDGETGFLVPAGDADLWRERIEEIAGWTEVQRAGFIAKAMAKAQERYCWQRVAKDVLEVYRDESRVPNFADATT